MKPLVGIQLLSSHVLTSTLRIEKYKLNLSVGYFGFSLVGDANPQELLFLCAEGFEVGVGYSKNEFDLKVTLDDLQVLLHSVHESLTVRSLRISSSIPSCRSWCQAERTPGGRAG